MVFTEGVVCLFEQIFDFGRGLVGVEGAQLALCLGFRVVASHGRAAAVILDDAPFFVPLFDLVRHVSRVDHVRLRRADRM